MAVTTSITFSKHVSAAGRVRMVWDDYAGEIATVRLADGSSITGTLTATGQTPDGEPLLFVLVGGEQEHVFGEEIVGAEQGSE